jgi:hypothetical protein
MWLMWRGTSLVLVALSATSRALGLATSRVVCAIISSDMITMFNIFIFIVYHLILVCQIHFCMRRNETVDVLSAEEWIKLAHAAAGDANKVSTVGGILIGSECVSICQY